MTEVPSSPRSPPEPATEQVTCRLVVRRVAAAQRARPRRAGRAVHHLAVPRVHHQLDPDATVGPTSATATTPSSSRSSPSSRTGRWPTCPPAVHRQRRLAGPAPCIAFNLARAAGAAASTRHARARWATLRRQLINIPARIASSARRLTVHLPQRLALGTRLADLWARATHP